jgi:hypothetical protein
VEGIAPQAKRSLYETFFTLGDEILKPIGENCRRDNECESTCCSKTFCSQTESCESERFTLVILVSIFCIAAIIGGVIAYIYCMKKRRLTRYDERLNSVRESSGGNHYENLKQPLNSKGEKKAVSANKALNQQSIN